MRQAFLLLGEIVRPQGIRGEVKVRHYTQDPRQFARLETLYLGPQHTPVRVTGARVQGQEVVLALQGVCDRNAAERLRGQKLYVDRAHARPLAEGEVFIAELLGAQAVDTQGRPLGTVCEVLTPGGVDVLVFDTPRGRLMVPAVGHVILEMDAQNGRVLVDESRLDEVSVYEDRHS